MARANGTANPGGSTDQVRQELLIVVGLWVGYMGVLAAANQAWDPRWALTAGFGLFAFVGGVTGAALRRIAQELSGNVFGPAARLVGNSLLAVSVVSTLATPTVAVGPTVRTVLHRTLSAIVDHRDLESSYELPTACRDTLKGEGPSPDRFAELLRPTGLDQTAGVELPPDLALCVTVKSKRDARAFFTENLRNLQITTDCWRAGRADGDWDEAVSQVFFTVKFGECGTIYAQANYEVLTSNVEVSDLRAPSGTR